MSLAWKIYAAVLAAHVGVCVYLASSRSEQAPLLWGVAAFAALILFIIWTDLCSKKE